MKMDANLDRAVRMFTLDGLCGPTPEKIADALDEAEKRGRKDGLEQAASRIRASVDLSGLEDPGVDLINCRLQSLHDAQLCEMLVAHPTIK